MKCPECGNEPLEVTGTIIKSFIGTFDDEGNLTTETIDERVVEIDCEACGKELPLTLIKNWN